MDAAWVEEVVLFFAAVGVTGDMWRTIDNFLVGTRSQVRIGDVQSHPCVDTGIVQGRLFARTDLVLLARCPSRSSIRFVFQFLADDVVIQAESAEDLQGGFDVVTGRSRKWRVSVGVSPEKSAVVGFCLITTTAFLFGYFEQHRGRAQQPIFGRHVDTPVLVFYRVERGLAADVITASVHRSAAFGLMFAGETRSLFIFL